MTTNTKTGKTTTKKTRCKMDSPICNDRAEAFVGPRPEILPKFFEVPSEREKKAFDLQAKGMTQREIAKELKTSQSTVHRAIKKYRFWYGMTLPEDRGELVGWARFRVAVEEQRIFLRHQQELAMEEWEQSRQPVKMKRKRTKVDPQGREVDGMPIKEIQIDEYVQRRHASAAHLNVAARRSLELTMLEAGYLGVRKLSCDQAIDVDDRDRWDRAVKSYQATIEELRREVAELKEQLAKNSTLHAPREEVFSRSVKSTLDESRTAQTTPARNQPSVDSQVASPIQKTPSDGRPDSPPPLAQKAESDESRAPSGGSGANSQPPAGRRPGSGVFGMSDSMSSSTPQPKTPDPEQYDERVEFCATRTPKWNSRYRQEALDLHCRIHGIPPLELHRVTGLPDPMRISPKLAIERGYPYHLFVDYSIPSKREPVRDKRKVITVW